MVFKQFQVWEWVQKSESFGPESGIITGKLISGIKIELEK